MEIIHRLSVEIVSEGLSKDEAIDQETELYYKYKDNGFLVNRFKPAKTKVILFDVVDKILYYDPTSPTGLRWKVDIVSGRYQNICKIKKGDVAGSIKSTGYCETKIRDSLYKNHRIVWVLNSKKDLIQNKVVHHLDGNPTNNVIENLQLVSHSGNMYQSANQDKEDCGVTVSKTKHVVMASWNDNLIRQVKTFNYINLFPGVDEEIAIEKCKEMAKWYREQMLASLNFN
jgi:hypothetical protein